MTDLDPAPHHPVFKGFKHLNMCLTSVLAVALLGPLAQATTTPPVFIKVYTNGVEEVQWTEQAGHLVGSYQLVYITKTIPPSLQAENRTFTGERNGSTLSLVFEQPFTSRQVWAGTLTENQLTLNVPQASGGLSSRVMEKSSASAYNRVVEQFRSTVATATVQAQAQRARQQALDQAVRAKQDEIDRQSQAVSTAQDTVKAILKRLPDHQNNLHDTYGDLLDMTGDFNDVLSDIQDDLKTIQNDAGEAMSCYEVDHVQKYDLNHMKGYDLGRLTGYVSERLTRRIERTRGRQQQLREAALPLQTAWTAFLTTVKSNPKSTTPVTVTKAAVDRTVTDSASALSEAEREIQLAVAQQQRTLDQANALIRQAESVAAKLSCQPNG